jgi:hypothetical protein
VSTCPDVIYPWAERVTLDVGTAYQTTSGTDNYFDEWGNTTSSYHYDWGNTTTATRVYNYNYVTGAEFASRNIRNRLGLVPWGETTN